MKKLIILTLFIIFSISIKAQSSPDFDKYNNYRTWIPDMSSDPLKYSPVKTVQVAFHVFLDGTGGRGVYTDDEASRNHLKDILSWVNGCYDGSPNGPSDPVSGVTELPDYDTRIQFSLGEPGQERFFSMKTQH